MGIASQGKEEGILGTLVPDKTLTWLGADIRGGEGIIFRP